MPPDGTVDDNSGTLPPPCEGVIFGINGFATAPHDFSVSFPGCQWPLMGANKLRHGQNINSRTQGNKRLAQFRIYHSETWGDQ